MPLTVDWSVTIDGTSYTDRFNRHVIEVEVEDKAGKESDTCRIKLDDTDGAIILPRKGATISVSILGEPVFEGKTETPRSTGARGQGRILTLTAKSLDSESKAKEGQHFHKDDATLEDYLKDFAKKAGISSIKVDKELGKIKRAWWGPEGRSFIHAARQLADDLGATFKLKGDKAVFAKRGKGETATGGTMPTVMAEWGRNLISWDIEPYDARPAVKDVRISRFDRKAAKFEEEKVDVDLGGRSSASSSARLPGTRADKDDAEARGKGKKTESERDSGGGSIEIDIDPTAKAEGSCELKGARDGADGTYRIDGATHSLTRAGATTKMQVKQPDEKAGQDGRKAGDTK